MGETKVNLRTRTESYEWGKIMFVFPPNEAWKAVFHPENLRDLYSLRVDEYFDFIDEQRKKWKVVKLKKNVFALYGRKKGIFRIY